MTGLTLVYATRKSALALAQSRAFARELSPLWPGLLLEELTVVTTGDRILNAPLREIGGKGLFTKEIEEALLQHKAHFAVHSFKDVPAKLDPRFVIACVPKRADPRDVLVTRNGETIDTLGDGAVIGTSSLRRAIELKNLRSDLRPVSLRGNVDTRLRKLEAREVDGIVLARAGLVRLGLADRASQILEPSQMIPAPGQGALAIECAADDTDTIERLQGLADRETTLAVAVERGAMESVGADCRVPFGAHATHEGDSLVLRLVLAGEGGAHPQRTTVRAAWPSDETEARRLGWEAGKNLLREA